MLSSCTEPGCTTFVYGVGACLAHQSRQTRVYIRGRPFVPFVAGVSRLQIPLAVPPPTSPGTVSTGTLATPG
jgi:hypothetical protein